MSFKVISEVEMVAKRTEDAGRVGGRLTVALAGGLMIGALLAIPASALSASAASSALAPVYSVQDQPERYVLAGTSGANLYNLPDPKARRVLEAEASTPLAVWGAFAGGRYLKVTVPGGVKVWVYGKYLVESQRPGWVEVSGSYVNMRPLPRPNDSYPLGQLDRGDRLRFVRRDDPSKPMSEDWVQVYSPPDTKAFVLAAETRSLPAGSNPATLWSAAVDSALARQGLNPVPTQAPRTGTASEEDGGEVTEASTEAPVVPVQGIFSALAAADKSMEAGLALQAPDYLALIAGYEAVISLGPDGPTRNLIQGRIETIRAHRELASIRAEVEKANAERERQLAELREKVQRSSRERDPLWGRFQARGWLERQRVDGEDVYLVRWGSEFLAQVQCTSGRYNLRIFDGFEVGIQGLPIRAASSAAGGYPILDVDRLEVISARSRHN